METTTIIEVNACTEELKKWLLRLQNLSQRNEREWRKYFLRNKMWIEDIESIGYLLTKSHESVVYKGYSEKEVFKVKQARGADCVFISTIMSAIYHNQLFPETFYKLVGFTDGANGVAVVLSQKFVKGNHPSNEQIIEYLKGNGFDVSKDGDMITACKDGYCARDIQKINAIIADSKVFVIDCNISYWNLKLPDFANFSKLF